MPRLQYRVTKDDYHHVRAYLSERMESVEIFKEGSQWNDWAAAREEFREFFQRSSPDKLQRWCEQYLNEDTWAKLKTALRQRRRRWAKFEDLKTITISAKAHKLLQRLAERDGATFSEVLEKVLARNLANAGTAMARKQKSR